MKLSKNSISSFVGDIIPLSLIAEDGEVIPSDVEFSAEPKENVCIRRFTGDRGPAMPENVIIVLLKEGETTVRVRCGKTVLSVSVCAHAMRTYHSGEALHPYVGDFHSHTSLDHNVETFPYRTTDLPADAVKYVKENGGLDFFTLSDHATILDDHDFFRTVYTADEMTDESLIVFGGMESENNLYEKDAYGRTHKNAGEYVTIQCDNYAPVTSWDENFERMSDNPCGFASFAHPQEVGWDDSGLWNYCLSEKTDERMLRFFRLTEVFNGTSFTGNMLHEFAYSKALDCGYHISPVQGSDSHGPRWGDPVCRGKSVILAPEKSKEAFVDAILHNRVYATETGNVYLRYEVNGYGEGETMPVADSYRFRVMIGALRKGQSADKIKKLSLISDYGRTVYEKTGDVSLIEEFEVKAPKARYFFLRLVDEDGKRTFSAPVFTANKPDPIIKSGAIKRKDKSAFVVESDLEGAEVLFNNDPADGFTASKTPFEVTVDLGSEQHVTGIGIYPRCVTIDDFLTNGKYDYDKQKTIFTSYPKDYEVYVAKENKEFRLAGEGTVRIFGGEEILSIPPCKVRYVKFRIKQNVGQFHGFDYPTVLGELDILE